MFDVVIKEDGRNKKKRLTSFAHFKANFKTILKKIHDNAGYLREAYFTFFFQ